MTLEWLGHACFLLTTAQGTRIVTDPYDDSVGYGSLRVRADAVTTSHGHHDHNYTAAVEGYEKLFDSAGQERFRDVSISSIESFHDPFGGQKRGKNLIFRFEADGKSVVHLGDLGHRPDSAQLRFIENADVLLIPIGGYFTIDTDEALKIIELCKPKAAVAMHYRNSACAFPISTEEQFSKALNARVLTGPADVGALSGAYVFSLPEKR